MGKVCMMCKRETMFYIWSSSRYFPRDKLMDWLNKNGNSHISKELVEEGVPICFACYFKVLLGGNKNV